MASIKIGIVLLACLVALASAAPQPIFFGKSQNKHYIIHVPYKVHTHHHHHTQYKHVHIPVYKEIVKHVPVHIPVYKEEHHGWSQESHQPWGHQEEQWW